MPTQRFKNQLPREHAYFKCNMTPQIGTRDYYERIFMKSLGKVGVAFSKMQPRPPIVDEKRVHKIAPISQQQYASEERRLGHVPRPKSRAFDKVAGRVDPDSAYPCFMQRNSDRNGLKTMGRKMLKENNYSNRDLRTAHSMFQLARATPTPKPSTAGES